MKDLLGNVGAGLKTIFVDGTKGVVKGAQKGAEVTREIMEEQTTNPNLITPEKKGFIGETRDKLVKWNESRPSVQKKKQEEEAKLVPYVLDPEKDAVKFPNKQIWNYVCRNEEGIIEKGQFAAFSKLDVYSYLTDEKKIVYSIETDKMTNFVHGNSGTFQTKIKTKELVFWLAQLSTYIKAGIPLTDAVRVLTKQTKNKNYSKIYDCVVYELTMGQPFSEALQKQGTAFPALLINMIKSAEMTGSIEETLDEMSEYYQEVEDTKRAVVSAMAYPSCVMVFAGGITVFMLVFIVPKFVSVYDSMGSDIPAITQFTLNLSAFLQNNWGFLILAVIGIIAAFITSYKKVKAFRTFMQKLFMKMPVIGKLLISKEMSMFARTFASLQKNNVLLTDSIDILAKITSNEIYKELELRTIENLIKGNKMSDTFKNHWAIPDVAYFMIVTGESTGELAEMLDRVADFYSKEEKSSVAMIKTFIEPIMIISLAVVVGFILMAVLIPMFGIYGTVA